MQVTGIFMPRTDGSSGKCEKLLVLEEDSTLRYLLSRVFEKHCWKVQAVDNSDAAVDVYKRDPPHVIVMEPVVDRCANWKFLALLASAPLSLTPPIIFATFLDFEMPIIPPGIEKCINVIATLIKPYDMDDLLRAVERGCGLFHHAKSQGN
jgi:CheY-like chemotaxis protein